MLLVLKDSLDPALEPSRTEEIKKFRALADAGTAVLVIAPRPSPPGNEETKASILGPFYLTELRAELVGKTLLGLRVDDVIAAVNFMQGSTTGDPNQITAEASGHLGLVLLHAAVLDPRLKHITIDHTLESYKSLLEAPMPIDAPEDILPGVLLHYDIPDIIKSPRPPSHFHKPTPRHRRPSNVNHGITLTHSRDLTRFHLCYLSLIIKIKRASEQILRASPRRPPSLQRILKRSLDGDLPRTSTRPEAARTASLGLLPSSRTGDEGVSKKTQTR